MVEDVTEYDDDYWPCESTFVTLRVFHNELGSAVVTKALGISPTREHQIGDLVSPRIHPNGPWRKESGWFLSSKDVVTSRDIRRHLDWLLDQLIEQRDEVDQLRRDGFRMYVSAYYECAKDMCGPIFSPKQTLALGQLGLEFWLDIYGPYDDEWERRTKEPLGLND